MKKKNIAIVAVSALLLTIMVMPSIVFPEFLTFFRSKPQGSLGILIVNPTSLRAHIDQLKEKYSYTHNTNLSSFDIKEATPGVGFRTIGESGISYKCEQIKNNTVVQLILDKRKIEIEKELLPKRLYSTLLRCALEKMNILNKDSINYLNDLVFLPDIKPAILL